MSKTILVVDDSPAEVNVMLSALQGRDYHLVTASDGEEALEKNNNWRPDLILLDIVLQKRNGYQICREIKAGRKFAPKIIMVSSKNEESDRRWGFKQGADGYLTRPLDLQVLADTVDKLL